MKIFKKSGNHIFIDVHNKCNHFIEIQRESEKDSRIQGTIFALMLIKYNHFTELQQGFVRFKNSLNCIGIDIKNMQFIEKQQGFEIYKYSVNLIGFDKVHALYRDTGGYEIRKFKEQYFNF